MKVILCTSGLLLWMSVMTAEAITLFRSSRIEMRTLAADSRDENAHPVQQLHAEDLAQLLSSLQVRNIQNNEVVYLMTENEAKELSIELVKGFGRVNARQDLYLSVFRHVGGFVNTRRYGTGIRLFFREGQINLIFGDIDVFFDSFRSPTLKLPNPGQRQHSRLNGGQLVAQPWLTSVGNRTDWVTFSVTPLPSLRDSIRLQNSNRPNETVTRSSITTPSIPDDISSFSIDTEKTIVPRSVWQNLEEGLETLSRLRQRSLITEAEYQEKRMKLLESVTQ